MRGRVFAAVATVALLGAAPAGATPRAAFERYASSVVAVTYFVETSFMREVRDVGGRDVGVVVGPDLVLINGSVITVSTTGAQPHGFRVRFLGGQDCGASLVGRDEFANVAFLRLDAALPPNVHPLQFKSTATPKIGDRVYAIGLLPENLEPMVHMASGLVTARIDRPKPFLVTDLSADEALGGPVFTDNGKLLGVLSELGESGPSFAAGFSGEGEAGYGLILDPETLARLIAQPPVKGETRRSWLGITLQALDHDKAAYWGLGDATGIIVNSVVPGSPAQQAGLQEGDIILGMNGEHVPVSQEEHVPIFIEQIGSRPVGSTMKLDVWRAGKRMTADVQLVAAPKSRMDAENYRSGEFELSVRELVFQDYRSFDLKPEFRGVLVVKVEEGGWAGVGGLETGDIIQRVDDRDIETPADLQQVLEAATAKRQRKLVFFVQRQGRTQFITVQPHWEGQS
jgi:S1-C subfamily serine protease